MIDLIRASGGGMQVEDAKYPDSTGDGGKSDLSVKKRRGAEEERKETKPTGEMAQARSVS